MYDKINLNFFLNYQININILTKNEYIIIFEEAY